MRALAESATRHSFDLCLARLQRVELVTKWPPPAMYLAAAFIRQRDVRQAASALRVAESIRGKRGYLLLGFFLDNIAALAALNAQQTAAACLFGAADAFLESHALKIEVEPWMEEVKRELRGVLGEERFVASYQAGRKLSLEETLTLMRDVLDTIG